MRDLAGAVRDAVPDLVEDPLGDGKERLLDLTEGLHPWQLHALRSHHVPGRERVGARATASGRAGGRVRVRARVRTRVRSAPLPLTRTRTRTLTLTLTLTLTVPPAEEGYGDEVEQRKRLDERVEEGLLHEVVRLGPAARARQRDGGLELGEHLG